MSKNTKIFAGVGGVLILLVGGYLMFGGGANTGTQGRAVTRGVAPAAAGQ